MTAESAFPRGSARLPERWLRALARRLVAWRWSRALLEGLCARRPGGLLLLTRLGGFPAYQVKKEIAALLAMLAESPPAAVLEIGTSRGGTLFLFSRVARPAATLVSVDLELRNPGLLRSFRRPRQRLHLLQGDSGSAEMIARVRELLPDGVDFLFIDGDHSYEGVRRDFEAYRGLVRPGGLIAFHDIVQDRGSRGGPATVAWSGEVPRFWSEVKADCRHRELIADPDQDGAGIGVLFTPRPDRRSPVEAP